MRTALKFVLRVLARRVLARYQPVVVGITGSVGKTTAKEAIYTVLHRSFLVRKSDQNQNNELGVPMTVLGMRSQAPDLLKACWLAFGIPRSSDYPRILILELGADRPGDIAYLTDLVRPAVAVITAVGEIPVHVEHYASPQAVAREKAGIMRFARHVVVNYDDPTVHAMAHGKPHTNFGLDAHADLWASEVAYYLDDHGTIEGLSFKIHRSNSFVPMRVKGLVAAHQLYAILAAVAVGLYFDLNLVEIGMALEDFKPPGQRMTIVRGRNNTWILDDTYNASPLSMRAALATLKDFGKGKRTVALLGRMAELGTYSEAAHRDADELARQCADVVLWCDSSDELLPKISDVIREGDAILIKGSRVTRMEKLVDVLREK